MSIKIIYSVTLSPISATRIIVRLAMNPPMKEKSASFFWTGFSGMLDEFLVVELEVAFIWSV